MLPEQRKWIHSFSWIFCHSSLKEVSFKLHEMRLLVCWGLHSGFYQALFNASKVIFQRATIIPRYISHFVSYVNGSRNLADHYLVPVPTNRDGILAAFFTDLSKSVAWLFPVSWWGGKFKLFWLKYERLCTSTFVQTRTSALVHPHTRTIWNADNPSGL